MSLALKSRFDYFMKLELGSIDLYLSPYCESRIEKIIDNGVERMGIDNVTERLDRIYVAEENLKRLLAYLCEYAKTVGTYPFLDDDAFDTALAECCPLWPFF